MRIFNGNEAVQNIFEHVRWRIGLENDPARREAFVDVSNHVYNLRKFVQPSMDEIVEEIELRGGW